MVQCTLSRILMLHCFSTMGNHWSGGLNLKKQPSHLAALAKKMNRLCGNGMNGFYQLLKRSSYRKASPRLCLPNNALPCSKKVMKDDYCLKPALFHRLNSYCRN